MKTGIKSLAIAVLTTGLVCCSGAGPTGTVTNAALESGFITPPDSIQTSMYWYWISGNITKEGVIKDLESMKEIGINRAFIGNIGLNETEAPLGPVKLFTDEWWEITHAALKRAGELEIDIGMFNCPGWSQSGGPWIEPGQSMRYLTSVSTVVEGGKAVDLTLSKPAGDYQDVSVIAIPALSASAKQLGLAAAKIHSSPTLAAINNLIDGNPDTEVVFDQQSNTIIDITFLESQQIRSLTIFPAHRLTRMDVELQVEEAGKYRTVSQFEIDRTRSSVDVGFDPFAPVVIALPGITGKDFRLALSGIRPGSGLKEIILSSHPLVERYPEKSLAKLHQTPLPYWHEYQWRRQPEINDPALIIREEQVLDISAHLNGDRLTWQAPEGQWLILRYGMLPTGMKNGPAAPEGRGLEVDKMTKAYLRHHFDAFLGQILKRIPAEDRKTLKVVVADSYEKGAQNFTDTFFEDFKAHYGYDPLPYLPVYDGIVVGSEDVSDRFLWDLRRMVADKLSYEHIGGLRELAQEHGMTLWLENYGHWGFPGEFLQYGGQSDEVAGEYWSEGTLGDIENRAASSCAHIYGKNKVSAESFTAGGKAYYRYPGEMKPRGDRFFSEGINNTLLHLYLSQPDAKELPGMNAPFGNEFNRNNTWFGQMDLFVTYLKRVNFMLQQGLNVADVCYFIGEDTPKMTGITDPVLPEGYQYDYINAEVIINNMTVKDGLLTLPHGTQYKMMVLPKLETMRPELLAKIKQLVEAGGVVMGPQPNRSPSLQDYPEADHNIRHMAGDLWGDVDGIRIKSAKRQKGLILCGMNMTEALASIDCIPDFSTPAHTPVLFGHRDLGQTQIYFVTNQSGETIEVEGKFRVKGMKPELWDAVSGTVRALPAYRYEDRTTAIPLRLEAFESVFLVFREQAVNGSADGVQANYPEPERTIEVTDSWTLTFQKNRRGPNEPVIMETLSDLSRSADERIRYFAGTIWYDGSVQLGEIPADRRFYINTGEVGVMAKVTVNGEYAGGLWTAPYRVDVTGLLKSGHNSIRIEVANNWMNRLIGDLRLPPEKRETWSPTNPWQADSPLQMSGLLRPVTIEQVKY